MHILSIDGLKKQHIEMLNYMWYQCKSTDQLFAWLESLEYEQMLTAQSLIELIRLETIDDEYKENVDLAKEVIQQIKNK